MLSASSSLLLLPSSFSSSPRSPTHARTLAKNALTEVHSHLLASLCASLQRAQRQGVESKSGQCEKKSLNQERWKRDDLRWMRSRLPGLKNEDKETHNEVKI